MPTDPWAAFPPVSAAPAARPAPGASSDPWAAFPAVPSPATPRTNFGLDRASGISATPWHAQGMFGGYGPSVQDALSVLPSVGGAIGGALGIGSGAFTGGTSSLPGAVGGAAIGGQGGEALRQLAMRAIGANAPATSAEAAIAIGQEGGVQAASELGGRALVSGLGKAVGTVLPAGEKQYAQALGATTVPNKQISERIVPELIDRRVYGSRERIKGLAERQVETAGNAIDAEIAKMPKGQAANVGAVMNQLQTLKKQYVVPSGSPGVNTIVDKAAYDNLSHLQKLVASTEPTFESVRRLRQILDGQVTAGNKAFGRTIEEGSKLDATREAANAIRAELAKVNPNVARINKEFSFWSDVDRVMGDTLLRTGPQAKGLGQTIAESVSVPAGVTAMVSGEPTVAAAVAIPILLRKIVQSPQWKTFSAVQKDRLADAIARGDAQQIGAFLGHSTVGLSAAVRSAQDGRP